MKIKVLKFGGTSVGSVEAIKRSANIICDWSKKSKVIAVLSAMSGETDRLIKLTKSFQNPQIQLTLITPFRQEKIFLVL